MTRILLHKQIPVLQMLGKYMYKYKYIFFLLLVGRSSSSSVQEGLWMPSCLVSQHFFSLTQVITKTAE